MVGATCVVSTGLYTVAGDIDGLDDQPGPGYPSPTSRAIAQNSATVSSSARAVGTIPARSWSGSTGMPSVLWLVRSILRRWPYAAGVTRSRAGWSVRACGLGGGPLGPRREVTLGGGMEER